MATTWGRGEVIFKWNGSHTINVFYKGKNVDVMTFGDMSTNEPPSKAEAYQRVKEYNLEDAKAAAGE